MNPMAIRRALFFDALYQVLDNRVFRILAVLTLVMLAVPWLIGFREQEVVIAWGWRVYEYRDILASFGPLVPPIQGSDQERVITGLVDLLVTNLAGTFGVFFALATTSFFVPRLLEKGAADPLFSKPVSRLRLLLARYWAGILFVALLAFSLMGGITAGLLVNSHYFDPTLLWSAVSLVYRFALYSAFATLVGVLTRSSTAALLLTLVFMGFTTLVHWAWVGMRWEDEQQFLSKLTAATREIEASPEVERVQEDLDVFVATLQTATSILHHALPKTIDADFIASLLRKKLEPAPFLNEIHIETRERKAEPDPKRPFRSRPLRLALRRDGSLEYQRNDELELVTFDPTGLASFSSGGRDISVRRLGERDLEVLVDEAPAELLPPPIEGPAAALGLSPPDWYRSQLGWDRPWRFNAWYSLSSSVAAAVVMLFLAWLRLRRINF